MSFLAKDQLMPSTNVSVFWIEHVLRHKGAKHLQLASRNLPFYQNYLLDIWLFLLIVGIIVLILFFVFVRFLLGLCFRKSKLQIKVKKQ